MKEIKDLKYKQLLDKLNQLKQQKVDKSSKQYQEIRNKIVEQNMNLVNKIVNRKEFQNLGIEQEDLQQMAIEELIKAVDDFDINVGNKFENYVNQTVYFKVRRAIIRTLKLNEIRKEEIQKLEKLERETLEKFHREPTDKEIKENLMVNDKKIDDLNRYMNLRKQESLEHLYEQNKEKILAELLDDEQISEINNYPIVNGVYRENPKSIEMVAPNKTEETAILLNMKSDIQKKLDVLEPQEKEILEMRLGLRDGKKLTIREIQKKCNIPIHIICKLEKQAIHKLQRPANARKLKDYWDIEEFTEYEGLYSKTEEQSIDEENIASIKNKLSELAELDEKIASTTTQIEAEKKRKSKKSRTTKKNQGTVEK